MKAHKLQISQSGAKLAYSSTDLPKPLRNRVLFCGELVVGVVAIFSGFLGTVRFFGLGPLSVYGTLFISTDTFSWLSYSFLRTPWIQSTYIPTLTYTVGYDASIRWHSSIPRAIRPTKRHTPSGDSHTYKKDYGGKLWKSHVATDRNNTPAVRSKTAVLNLALVLNFLRKGKQLFSIYAAAPGKRWWAAIRLGSTPYPSQVTVKWADGRFRG